jgi:hypothetical protein
MDELPTSAASAARASRTSAWPEAGESGRPSPLLLDAVATTVRPLTIVLASARTSPDVDCIVGVFDPLVRYRIHPMGKTQAMSVFQGRLRRTLVALGALAVLMLTTGQACATPPNAGSGTSHATATTKTRHSTSTKNKYDQYGYDQAGYDRDGYDKNGYDKNGYNRQGYNRQGYDRNGYDRYGYDQDGFNKEGCNRAGYDRNGDRCSSDGGHSHKDDDHKDDDS